MIYAFKRTHFLPAAMDPQAVGEELERIRARSGALTPDAVVETARVPESALHAAFEWDDGLAAEAHRKHQARQLIASVTVMVEGGASPEPIRAFVNVFDDAERLYEPIQVVLSDKDLREQMLQKALIEAKSWQARYRDLHELAKVFTAIERTAVAIEKTVERAPDIAPKARQKAG